jgi:hypothetical protein
MSGYVSSLSSMLLRNRYLGDNEQVHMMEQCDYGMWPVDAVAECGM